MNFFKIWALRDLSLAIIAFGAFEFLGGRFGYISIFSARGRGRGPEAPEKGVAGVVFFLRIPGGGVLSRTREEEGGGEGSGGCLRECGGGGGANIFFRGRNAHQGSLSQNTSIAWENWARGAATP